MNFAVVFTQHNLLLFGDGLITTLSILLWCLLAGGVCAVPLAIARNLRIKLLRYPVWGFTYAIRGTPLLVQVYLVYYGIAQLEWVQAVWDDVWPWTLFKQPFFCLVFAFSINTCAYTVEILAGAIRETPAGEIEAGQAAGFNRVQLMLWLVLPSAMRRALPAYSNEVIMMLHSTSLASVVPLVIDVTGVARAIYSRHFLPFEAFITAGIIYFIVTFVCTYGLRQIERRYLGHLRRD